MSIDTAASEMSRIHSLSVEQGHQLRSCQNELESVKEQVQIAYDLLGLRNDELSTALAEIDRLNARIRDGISTTSLLELEQLREEVKATEAEYSLCRKLLMERTAELTQLRAENKALKKGTE